MEMHPRATQNAVASFLSEIEREVWKIKNAGTIQAVKNHFFAMGVIMTAFMDQVAGWARVFSSHQENIPTEFYRNEAGEEKSSSELLATFREYWGDEAVDKAIKHVEATSPMSESRALVRSHLKSGSSVSS